MAVIDVKNETEKGKRLTQISQLWLSENTRWGEIYDEIQSGYDFLGGKQYTEDQIKYYNSKRRPVNVFNEYLPIFTMYLGMYYMAQGRTKVHSKRGGDAFLSARIEDLFNHYELQDETIDEFGRTMLSGMIKLGWMRAEWSDAHELDGGLVMRNVDEFDILFDSRARHPLLDDARYLIRSRWVEPDDMMRIWPGKRKAIEQAILDKNDAGYYAQMAPDVAGFAGSAEYFFRGKYRVLEFCEIKYEEHPVAIDPDGEWEIITLEGKARKVWEMGHPDAKTVDVEVKIKKVSELAPSLLIFLDEYDAPLQDGCFDYVNYSSFPFGRMTIDSFGFHRPLKSVAKAHNDSMNTTQDIFNKQSSAGMDVKPDLISNFDDLLQSGTEPGFITQVEQNATIADAIRRHTGPNVPPSAFQMSEIYRNYMHIISNATQNFMGSNQTSAENASLFAQRVQEQNKGSMVSTRAYRRMHKRIAEKALRLLQSNLTPEKYFLITGEIYPDPETQQQNEMAAEQVIGAFQTGEFRVVLDDQAANPTAKLNRFLQKKELAMMLAQYFGPTAIPWRDFLRDSEMGDMEKWIKLVEAASGQLEQATQEKLAFDTSANLLDLAQKKQTMSEVTDEPKEAGVPGVKPGPAD